LHHEYQNEVFYRISRLYATPLLMIPGKFLYGGGGNSGPSGELNRVNTMGGDCGAKIHRLPLNLWNLYHFHSASANSWPLPPASAKMVSDLLNIGTTQQEAQREFRVGLDIQIRRKQSCSLPRRWYRSISGRP
jgi:hypothetical protein